MLGGKAAVVLDMGMKDAMQCKVQNEGATTAALVWCQVAGSAHTVPLPTREAGHQMLESCVVL